MPHRAAGPRIEPPVSEPSAPGIKPAATAAPVPLDEPPVKWSRSQGLRAGGHGRPNDGPPWANACGAVGIAVRSFGTMASLSWLAVSGLGHLIMQRGAVEDALIAEPRQVKGLVPAVEQQFTQATTDRRRLHQPMAGKTQGDVE